MRYANRDYMGGSGEANKLVELQFSDGKRVQISLVAVSSSANDFDHVYTFPPVTTTYVKIVVKSTYVTVNNGAEEIRFGTAGNISGARPRPLGGSIACQCIMICTSLSRGNR